MDITVENVTGQINVGSMGNNTLELHGVDDQNKIYVVEVSLQQNVSDFIACNGRFNLKRFEGQMMIKDDEYKIHLLDNSDVFTSNDTGAVKVSSSQYNLTGQIIKVYVNSNYSLEHQFIIDTIGACGGPFDDGGKFSCYPEGTNGPLKVDENQKCDCKEGRSGKFCTGCIFKSLSMSGKNYQDISEASSAQTCEELCDADEGCLMWQMVYSSCYHYPDDSRASIDYFTIYDQDPNNQFAFKHCSQAATMAINQTYPTEKPCQVEDTEIANISLDFVETSGKKNITECRQLCKETSDCKVWNLVDTTCWYYRSLTENEFGATFSFVSKQRKQGWN